ncbi:unnamed protein product [Heterobilharzia americana]|nr:unnamed protein product [Heterobilharzia americana]
MGAEQSVGYQKSSNFQQNHQSVSSQSKKKTGHSSVPSSPKYDLHHQSLSGQISTSSYNNNSTSSLITTNQQQRGSLSSLPEDIPSSSFSSVIQRLDKSQKSFSTKSLSYSFDKSVTTRKQTTGILTVNRGRQTSSQYELGNGNGDSNTNATNNHTEYGLTELKKLHRISTFEPLLSTRNQLVASNSHSSTSFKNKQFTPNLPEFECEELMKISSIYEQYLYKYASEVSQKQSDIIVVQNKIDRDLSQLSERLQAREKGMNCIRRSTSSTFRSPFSSPKKNIPVSELCSSKLAGSQQIEMIVLLTSQISGLMSQCDELSKQLMDTVKILDEKLCNQELNKSS